MAKVAIQFDTGNQVSDEEKKQPMKAMKAMQHATNTYQTYEKNGFSASNASKRSLSGFDLPKAAASLHLYIASETYPADFS